MLHARLAKIDPEAADEIHPNNVKRVIRALEFNHQTGKRYQYIMNRSGKKIAVSVSILRTQSATGNLI